MAVVFGLENLTYFQNISTMAERGAKQPAELLPPGQQKEGSDDETIASNEPINPQQLSRFESELKDEVSSIASQV